MKYIFIIILSILIVGCGGTFNPLGEDKLTRKESGKDKYNPIGLKEDIEIVPIKHRLKFPADSNSIITDSVIFVSSDTLISETVSNNLYCIQLFTSKEYGSALRESNTAEEVFDREISFDYEVPYYKVRVGRFASREEAEKYVPVAKDAGYKTAWVVKTYANIRTLEDIYNDDIPITIDTTEYDNMEIDTAKDVTEYPEN